MERKGSRWKGGEEIDKYTGDEREESKMEKEDREKMRTPSQFLFLVIMSFAGKCFK